MAFTMVTLDTGGGYRLADGSTPRAVLHATPYVPMTNGTTTVDQTVTILLDASGVATKAVAATTDPATTPAGNAYRLRIEVDGYTVQQLLAAIPHNAGSTVDISSLIPLIVPPDFPPIGGGYSDEQVRDVVAATLVQGANVTITPNDAANTITIAAATSGASGIPASTVDAKGDLIAGTANDTVARLAVAADGLALVAASGQATGLQWAAPAPAAHNHAGSEITSGTVAPARLGSGTADSATFLRGDQTWATPAGSGYATVRDEGTALTQRTTLNFAGAGVTATDDAANSRTLVTIPGGSGSGPVTGLVYATDASFAGGAKFDGTTDDTAALQAFVTYICNNSYKGILPRGVAKITGALDFPCVPRWTIEGQGRTQTTIKQFTNNIPIFNLGSNTASYLHGFQIRGMEFDYNTSQGTANTNANPILLSQEGFEAVFYDLGFKRGTYGIRVANTIGGPWGCTFDELIFESGLTRGAMDWSQATSAVPNNRYGRMFCDATNMIGPCFDLRAYNAVIETLEFVAGYQGPVLLRLNYGGALVINAVKIENGTWPADGRVMFDFPAAINVVINEINFSGNDFTITGSGDLYAIRAVDGNVSIGSVYADASTTITTGAWLTSGQIEIDRIKMSSGWRLLNSGGSENANTTFVNDWARGRISQDKGNANYTIVLGDPNTLIFNTTLTAARTVTLPAATDNLFNGLYYDVVSAGAVNGANTIAIKDGATTVATVSADNTRKRVAFRRNSGAPANQWVAIP